MLIQSFNSELGLANLMFQSLFRDIQIQRSNGSGEQKLVKVNCVFGQRSRIFKNWQNSEKKGMMKLPMIVIDRTGYARNNERLNNMHNEVKYEVTAKNRIVDLLTPVPIDVSYDVSIVAKYPSDIDQIASNFMVFFNNDGYVSMQHPKYEEIQLNNQIILADQVTEEHLDELDGTTNDFIASNFQFTFKTYLFGGKQQAKKVPRTILSAVTSSFVSCWPYELDADDIANISQFLNEHPYPDYKLSTILTSNVTAEISVEVPNPDLSDYVYDGFTPIIKNIEVGFYPTPMISGFVPYINEVDSYQVQWPYVDRLSWNIPEK